VQAGSHATAPAAPHATQQMAPTAQQVAPQALEQAPHPHTAQQAPQDAQTEGPASPLWMLADVSQGGDTSRNADNAGQPSASSGAALLAPPPRPPPVRAVPVAATLCRSAVCNVANGTATSAEMASTSAAGGSVPAQNATQQSPAWPFGHSPGFSEVAHYLQNNSPSCSLSPSTFCTLLSSPDLHQLESPRVGGALPQDATLSAASWTACSNAPASATHPPPGFSQFKRRQTCLPSNLIPSNLKV